MVSWKLVFSLLLYPPTSKKTAVCQFYLDLVVESSVLLVLTILRLRLFDRT